MKDNCIPESACIECGKLSDAATCMGADALPGPGDITVCIYCGHIMAFADDMSFRNLTDAEVVEFAGDPRILAIQDMREMLKLSDHD